jgi:glyoxylase-like metal-dependent hydrolase (beta-lactamase superfamily II)
MRLAIDCVLAPNPGPMTLTGTNSYVLWDNEGQVAIIDPGPNEPSHIDALARAAQARGRLTTIMVTHRHLDHLPAAAPLCAATGAVLVGHADLPGVERPAGDGNIVFGTLLALTTPGHTRESLSFWDPPTGSLFTGDLVAGTGTVVVDEVPGALSDYLASLEKLQALAIKTIYPGHGPRVDDAPAKIDEYLTHRRQRVQQVVDALEATPDAGIDDLVSTIYPDLKPILVAAAARNVRANLDLLTRDGRVVAVDHQRWRLSR